MNALQAYKVSGGLAPPIFNVAAVWKWVEYFNQPSGFNVEQQTPVQIERDAALLPHRLYRRFGEK